MSSPTPVDSDPRVQRGMEDQLRQRRGWLDGGAQRLGWKLGFGSAAAMERLGTKAPLIGSLTKSTLVASPMDLSIAGWSNPLLEPEVAVHVSSDVDEGVSAGDVSRVIGGYGCAIELVDPDPNAGVEDILRTNIYHRHVLLGEPAAHALDGVVAHVTNRGNEVAATSEIESLTGEVPMLVAHVANTLPAFGERLRAGDVIICGSVVPAIRLQPGDDVVVDLTGLGRLEVRVS